MIGGAVARHAVTVLLSAGTITGVGLLDAPPPPDPPGRHRRRPGAASFRALRASGDDDTPQRAPGPDRRPGGADRGAHADHHPH